MASVLIIDDESGVRDSMALILRMEGYNVDSSESAIEALNLIGSNRKYDFIICDIKMPGMDGIEFLKEFRKHDKDSVVIMISAYGTVETSINSIKSGASDYITKPVNADELLLRMRMAQERKRLEIENLELKKELRKEFGFEDIVYKDDRMHKVVELARKVSDYKTTVLITGESGTGKELIARSIHNSSSRASKPFIGLNCAAIPENLLESELFGYEQGAFSGADSSKTGLFEAANGGTLFLDEIGEIPLSLQPKLLRALQEEEIRRLGGTKSIKLNVRILAATSTNLALSVQEKEFRDDLYYRLNVLPIEIPPLRERKEDIPELVQFFLEKYQNKLGSGVKSIGRGAMSRLMENNWYGNIRELENTIERAMILCEGDTIEDLDFLSNPEKTGNNFRDDSLSLQQAWKKLEKTYIEKALTDSGGNRTRAANILGISRRGLLYKMKEYDLGSFLTNDEESES